ncbi:MAG: hypothetical protein QM572_11895 [Nocardioides sp.]|uniref:hypothetical protein n=1 Tax=Nocardioides sp. TaxID=35761 RepID=UPI0039E4ECC4
MTSSLGQDDTNALRQIAQSPCAKALRRAMTANLSEALSRHGELLRVEGHLLGSGRVDATSPGGNGDDRQVAAGYLAQTVGSLLRSVVLLIDEEEFYAAAALARQLVETEYLLWVFAHEPGEAATWLNTSADERRAMWQPRHLRSRSQGRFLAKDYSMHCELGGHPTPEGMQALINTPDAAAGEVTLVDALGHAISSWESAGTFLAAEDTRGDVAAAIARWHEEDPLYAALAHPPEDSGGG